MMIVVVKSCRRGRGSSGADYEIGEGNGNGNAWVVDNIASSTWVARGQKLISGVRHTSVILNFIRRRSLQGTVR